MSLCFQFHQQQPSYQSPTCKCSLVGFHNFLIFLLETINIVKKGFSKKIQLSIPGTSARTARWAATFRGSLHHGSASPPIETSILSPLDHCSSFLQSLPVPPLNPQQSMLHTTARGQFKIQVSFQASPQFKPPAPRTSHLCQNQSQNPNNGSPRPFVTCHYLVNVQAI